MTDTPDPDLTSIQQFVADIATSDLLAVECVGLRLDACKLRQRAMGGRANAGDTLLLWTDTLEAAANVLDQMAAHLEALLGLADPVGAVREKLAEGRRAKMGVVP